MAMKSNDTRVLYSVSSVMPSSLSFARAARVLSAGRSSHSVASFPRSIYFIARPRGEDGIAGSLGIFPMEQIAEANRYMETAAQSGKVVVTV